jgi:hypothetical protein
VKQPTVKQIAQKAAELLEEHGWCQHASRGLLGNLCMMQAVTESICNLIGNREAENVIRLYTFVSGAIDDKVNGSPVRWNDTRGRTKEEVLGLLRSL